MTVSATLLGTLLHGVAASRPAANAVAGGTIYSATDTGAITQSDGSSWSTFATISSGLADPMSARGDLIYRNPSNVTARLPIGSSGKVLSSDGTDVSWQTPSGGSTASFVRAYRNTTQSISSATLTAVQLNAEDEDIDAYHDTVTNNTRLTVPTGKAGVFRADGYIFTVTNGLVMLIQFRKNGSTTWAYTAVTTANSSSGALNTTGPIRLADADYLEMMVYTTSGSTIGDASNHEQQCWASLTRIGS